MNNKPNLDDQLSQNQSPKARKFRLKQGRCPLHDKPMLQCDGWYQNRDGRRYTITSCIDNHCQVEALTDLGFWAYQLTPKWQYLLEQNEQGRAQVFNLSPEANTTQQKRSR